MYPQAEKTPTLPLDTMDAETIVARAITQVFPNRIAVVSSFGTEAAVLLHMVAKVDPSVPVIFLDTGKHFDETLAHRDRVVRRLGLTDVRTVQPAISDVLAADPDGMLWSRDPDACCRLRKVEPLPPATLRFEALFSGRKRHHGNSRAALDVIDTAGDKIKINPLADWDRSRIQAYMDKHGLPRHPLEAAGYPSIGCAVCTSRVAPGEDFRAGRWRGTGKTECGLHTDASGR